MTERDLPNPESKICHITPAARKTQLEELLIVSHWPDEKRIPYWKNYQILAGLIDANHQDRESCIKKTGAARREGVTLEDVDYAVDSAYFDAHINSEENLSCLVNRLQEVVYFKIL